MTYNVELTDKPDQHGLHHVMIRLHVKDQKPARIQTEIQVEGKHWNPKKKWGKWIRSAHPHADTENRKIEAAHKRIKEAIEALLLAQPSLTPKEAKLRFETNVNTSLSAFDPASLLDQSRSFSTNEAKVYNWNAFLRWAGPDLSIEQITYDLVNRYARSLLAGGKKNSTINEYIADLREFYTLIQQKRGLSMREILATSPFIDWKNLKINTQKKGRLHQAGIEKLESEPYKLFDKHGKVIHGSRIDWSRWCWLACHYLAGMRIGDLMRSRYEWFEVDETGLPIRLSYQMQKNGRFISIPVSAKVRAHLAMVWRPDANSNHYLLPFLSNDAIYAKYRTYEQIKHMPVADAKALKKDVSSATAQLNAALKKVVIKLGISVIGSDTLTNHTARHSFADKVRLAIKNGKTDAKGRPVTNFDAKDLLGHRFMSTTEMYFGDMDQEMLDAAMDALNEE